MSKSSAITMRTARESRGQTQKHARRLLAHVRFTSCSSQDVSTSRCAPRQPGSVNSQRSRVGSRLLSGRPRQGAHAWTRRTSWTALHELSTPPVLAARRVFSQHVPASVRRRYRGQWVDRLASPLWLAAHSLPASRVHRGGISGGEPLAAERLLPVKNSPRELQILTSASGPMPARVPNVTPAVYTHRLYRLADGSARARGRKRARAERRMVRSACRTRPQAKDSVPSTPQGSAERGATMQQDARLPAGGMPLGPARGARILASSDIGASLAGTVALIRLPTSLLARRSGAA